MGLLVADGPSASSPRSTTRAEPRSWSSPMKRKTEKTWRPLSFCVPALVTDTTPWRGLNTEDRGKMTKLAREAVAA